MQRSADDDLCHSPAKLGCLQRTNSAMSKLLGDGQDKGKRRVCCSASETPKSGATSGDVETRCVGGVDRLRRPRCSRHFGRGRVSHKREPGVQP